MRARGVLLYRLFEQREMRKTRIRHKSSTWRYITINIVVIVARMYQCRIICRIDRFFFLRARETRPPRVTKSIIARAGGRAAQP